MLSQTVSV